MCHAEDTELLTEGGHMLGRRVEDILGKYIFKNSGEKAALKMGGKKEYSTNRRSQASNR